MTPLTPEQEAEFTIFNCAVYDLHRTECQQRESIPPCWLCMSDNAKQEAKEKFAAWLSGAMQVVVPFTVEVAERKTNERFGDKLDHAVKAWKSAELEYKRLREDENNPRAFFVGG
jgi:hypothetical protein